VPHDFVQAHKWYNLAATNGDKPAAELRDALAKQMTPAQIAEAKQLARERKPKGK
jgi:TPR repeat protein